MPSGIVVVLHAAMIALVALSIIALHPPRES